MISLVGHITLPIDAGDTFISFLPNILNLTDQISYLMRSQTTVQAFRAVHFIQYAKQASLMRELLLLGHFYPTLKILEIKVLPYEESNYGTGIYSPSTRPLCHRSFLRDSYITFVSFLPKIKNLRNKRSIFRRTQNIIQTPKDIGLDHFAIKAFLMSKLLL